MSAWHGTVFHTKAGQSKHKGVTAYGRPVPNPRLIPHQQSSQECQTPTSTIMWHFSPRLISITPHMSQSVRHSYLLPHSLLPLYFPHRLILDRQPIHRHMKNLMVMATLTFHLFLVDLHGTQGWRPVPTYSRQNCRIIVPGGAPSVTVAEASLTCYLGRIPAMATRLISSFTHS